MLAFFLQADFLLFVRPHFFESLGGSSFDFLYGGPQLCQGRYTVNVLPSAPHTPEHVPHNAFRVTLNAQHRPYYAPVPQPVLFQYEPTKWYQHVFSLEHSKGHLQSLA
jgi:hypothetical protein